ncbi:MAG: lipid biosynthesis B12-binding/radical SAM protein [Nitrospirota bacterium]|nr:lipid biosynthesis B12-binding/radical SAM protein [Nitrospirota bacterium]
MRVLLVSPNREHLPDPVFPLGLSYIASAIINHGHAVRVIDLCFSEDTDSDIREAINAFQPEVIGMSLRNIDDVAFPKQHSYVQEYKTAIGSLRTYSGAPIVLGGSGFTIMPEALMQELRADFGIVGEGEKAFPELLRRLGDGGEKIVRSPERLKDLDSVIPDRDLFDCNAYYRLGGMLNIQTKRGCPFECIYCTYPRVEGRTVRMRSAKAVADEIEQIMDKTGARHFFFVDSIFNYPVLHAMDICEEIIQRDLKIQWSCYANPAHMTEDLAGTMVKAGCTGVEFGTDSLVDEMLGNLGKSFTYSIIKEASDLCRKSGLKFCHFIFAGAPGETDETVMMNLERLEELQPDAAVIMAGIRIFPNTALADRADKELGLSNVGLRPVFYHSSRFSDYDRVTEAVSKKKNWIMPGYEINIYPRLQKKLRERGIKGALWEELAKR